MKSLYQVIKEPVITEKSAMQVANSKYTFEVEKRASKGEIKQAVEKIFGVTVLDVHVMNVKGKGKKPDWKKTVVTLKEGDKIGLFEVGG